MTPTEHLAATRTALASLDAQLGRLASIGQRLAEVLGRGGRCLVVGNGGSAAEAQHFTAELVGRYGADRRPLSALALHAETSSLTAITNDFGASWAFARQVEAHGRAGDALVALSTSGRSANVLEAIRRARSCELWTIGLTGSLRCPMAELVDDLVAVEGPAFAVQEAHLVALHLLCESIDEVLAPDRTSARVPRRAARGDAEAARR
ncbi:MAG TPA: SIS domain-containing protein [Acidimicrobiales bacterium]|jgi:D-sedoheptulose 7-phosphate isomerase